MVLMLFLNCRVCAGWLLLRAVSAAVTLVIIMIAASAVDFPCYLLAEGDGVSYAFTMLMMLR